MKVKDILSKNEIDIMRNEVKEIEQLLDTLESEEEADVSISLEDQNAIKYQRDELDNRLARANEIAIVMKSTINENKK